MLLCAALKSSDSATHRPNASSLLKMRCTSKLEGKLTFFGTLHAMLALHTVLSRTRRGSFPSAVTMLSLPLAEPAGQCCATALRPAGKGYLLLDQLLEKDWIAFCLRPLALAVQQVCSFQVIIIKVVLALCPLHAGRDFVKDACWDAMLQQVCELCVRVLHACGKGLQEVKTEWLAGSHEKKAICLRARWVQASMCDFCQV